MARDVYGMTVTMPVVIDAASGPDITALTPLSNVTVAVYLRGTTTAVQIFQRPTGATEGPTPESGASGGPNPFITGTSGNVEFWAEGPAELDVVLTDNVTPARTPKRTFGWNVFPAAAGSLPTTALAKDAAIGVTSMGPDVLRQMIQIGQVIDWWRPNDSVPLPAGFVVCDGTAVPAGQHEFPGVSGSVNVPDLRNRMILGADPTKVWATGANQGDASTDAPAIAGTGGSNAAKNFAHGHGVPGVSHQHYVRVPDHLHSAGSLATTDHLHLIPSVGTGASNSNTPGGLGSGSWASGAYYNHAHSIGQYWSGASDRGLYVGGNTGACTAGSTGLYVYSDAANVSLNTATNSLTWTVDPGTDVRPRFYGLLKLMKVRRS